MGKVLIIDTSILCVWFEVPNNETCGNKHDLWDRKRVALKIEKETKQGTIFVLPLATIIETGNHISQAPRSRRETALKLADLVGKSADAATPWAAFSEQATLWSNKKLKELAKLWPDLAASKLSLGDATIKDVAEYYAKMGNEVEILTGDAGLKSYQPSAVKAIPRRRELKG